MHFHVDSFQNHHLDLAQLPVEGQVPEACPNGRCPQDESQYQGMVHAMRKLETPCSTATRASGTALRCRAIPMSCPSFAASSSQAGP